VTVSPTDTFAASLAAASSSSTTSSTSTSSTDDYDMFLQLLVAQLKYQDPMNPTDSTQFLSQNAQFTSLQKMGELNDTMTSMLSVQSSFGSTNLIGKTVTYANADGTTGSGVATGVTFYSGGPVLTVDGKEVAVSQVITVGSTASSGTTDTTDTTA
jgi:flagellar basal-body rod modification protein FlgD